MNEVERGGGVGGDEGVVGNRVNFETNGSAGGA